MVETAEKWLTYEDIATKILHSLREELCLSGVECKQSVTGRSGTYWELDAKGITADGRAFILIECRRHTTSRIKQAAVAGVAWTILDVGAAGGLIVSPLGLQEGAAKVAAVANIHSVTLSADATPQEFVLKFLDRLFVGLSGVDARFQTGNLTPVVVNDSSGGGA